MQVSKKIERFANWISGLSTETKSFVVASTFMVAAIGPALLGLGKLLMMYKDLQIAIRGVTFLLAGNPLGIAALAITGIALAVGQNGFCLAKMERGDWSKGSEQSSQPNGARSW